MAAARDLRWGFGSATLLTDGGETLDVSWGLGSIYILFEYSEEAEEAVSNPRDRFWFLYFGNYSHRRR